MRPAAAVGLVLNLAGVLVFLFVSIIFGLVLAVIGIIDIYFARKTGRFKRAQPEGSA